MAKKEERGKILQFPALPRKPPRDPLDEEDVIRKLDRGACVSFLEAFADVPDSFRRLLDIPDRLFKVGKGRSLTSDPRKNISGIAFALISRGELKPDIFADIPDYAIHITYRSSTDYCILLDKRRKILVMESLGNPLGGESATWRHMAKAIEDALAARDRYAGRGDKFSLVVSREMLTEAI